MGSLAVIGHLSRDTIAGGRPAIGGGAWHAARAFRQLGVEATVLAKCGRPDRDAFGEQLAALGLPLSLSTDERTTAFAFAYDERGVRTMAVEAIGEPWREDELPHESLAGAEWLQVAPLLRGDVDAALLGRLAEGRRLLLDGQGLVRARRTGPLRLDGDFDRELLRHVAILKLAEEEARAIVGDAELESLAGLGVPEVIVTFGLAGSLVLAGGLAERVRAEPVDADPTGAGDAFGAAYLTARAAGRAPVAAAERASALVAEILDGRHA